MRPGMCHHGVKGRQKRFLILKKILQKITSLKDTVKQLDILTHQKCAVISSFCLKLQL